MTEAVSGVTSPSVAPVEVKKPEETTGTVATTPSSTEPKKIETNEVEVGAGVAQATPTESQAKKLYITA